MHRGNTSAKKLATLSPKLAAFAYSQATGGYPVQKATLKNHTWRQVFIKDVHVSGDFTVNPSFPKILQPNEEFEFEIEVGDSFVSEARNGFIMVEFHEGDPTRLTLSQEETTGAASPEEALQEEITGLTATVEGIGVTIQNLNDQIAALLTADGSVNALIAEESQYRIDGDTALASTLSLMGAVSGDSLAFILDLDSVYVSPTESLTQRFSALSSAIGDNTAAIVSNQETIVTDISAEASRIDVLTANLGENTAAITNEATARATADGALATSIDTLSTTVGENTASISTQQTTIDGLNARYTLALNVNGHITGYTAENDGVTGSFTIVADEFAIVDPNGGAPITPFQIVNGQVIITSAQIGTLSVDNLIDGSLTADVGLDGDITVENGHIIFDNGTFMKVQGIGFGTVNQFIEWFGPSMDYNICSEANAISYLKTNGDAYFGGTLSAGILKNAAQSTSIADDASLQIGPFDTNGGPINVVTSYSLKGDLNNTYAGTSQGESDWDAALSAWGYTGPAILPGGDVIDQQTLNLTTTIQVDRTIAGVGSDIPWNTLTIGQVTKKVTGLKPIAAGTEQGYLHFETILSGSMTNTDATGGTEKRTFVATITSRNLGSYVGTITSQNLSVIATE